MAGFRVEQVHAFVATGPDDEEGVIAFWAPGMGWMPMVAADPARVESLRPIAQARADEIGMQIKLIRFGGAREDLETFTPRGAGNA